MSHSSNNTITGNTARRIQLTSSNNNSIMNNIVSNNPKDYGIYLSRSSDNIITSNTVSNSSLYGIYLQFSSSNVVTGNEVSNNQKYGISLRSSSNNAITGNNVSDNRLRGISLSCSSDNNIITGNTASNNEGGGIYLFYDPIWDVTANNRNNILTDNIVSNNRLRGIYLYSSSDNIIANNTISNNSKSGISLYSSSDNNSIYNNYFNNTNNSYDNGNNTWNITKTAGTNIVGGPYLGGNYWCDYNGTDLDGDKLGDTQLPYNCSGRIQNDGDWHPLIIIPKIILKASKDGYASAQHEIDNDENFERIEISGNVTDKSTGEPIEGAKIEIVKGANPASITTGADGTYTITAIIPEGSESDTREGVDFELPPAQYVVGVYEISSEVTQLIEDNNGTILDHMDRGEGHRAYLVKIPKEEEIDPFIKNVNQSPSVKYVELNYVAKLEYVPNDLQYPFQWGPRRIRAGGLPDPSAWDYETGIRSIKIAIIDSGIQYDHVDLYRFGDGTIKYVYGYDWVDGDNDPYPLSATEDHGTHCAGIATAVMDNSKVIAGIAPNCSLMVEKVVSPGSVWTVSEGIYDAADHDADVISMSLSYGWDPHPLVENACDYAWHSNCILVAASGNQFGGLLRPWFFTSPRIRYPAAHDSVIAVGAINSNDQRPAFSNWGTEDLELVAPGVNILSTVPWDTYDYMSGTSMATPHVAGVVALLKSRAERWPEEPLATEPRYHLNNGQIRKILRLTADDIGSPGWDNVFGYGVVSAERALRCVNISGNVLESVFNVPIPHPLHAPAPPEVRVTSIEGPPGIYTTNENTTLARITPDGDYFVMVPPGVYSICAMAYGYIPSHGLGGERVDLPAFDLMGQLNEESRGLSLVPFPCNVTGNVTDSVTGLPIADASISLDGPPHIYPPHPNVHMETETDSNGNYSFILEYGVHPPYPIGEKVYNITVSKSGYQTQTQNFTLNWSDVVKDYYKCPLDPKDYDPPIVNFSLLSGPSYLPDLTLTSEDIQFIPPSLNSMSLSSSKQTTLVDISNQDNRFIPLPFKPVSLTEHTIENLSDNERTTANSHGTIRSIRPYKRSIPREVSETGVNISSLSAPSFMIENLVVIHLTVDNK